MGAILYRGRLGKDGGFPGRVDVIEHVRADHTSIDPLPVRLDLANHSPTGFAWGFSGSGPGQLALAILAHALEGDSARALRLHQPFKRVVIAQLSQSRAFELSRDEVLAVVARIEARHADAR